MPFRITSLALGQSYDCASASEVTLKDIGKSIIEFIKIYNMNKTEHDIW